MFSALIGNKFEKPNSDAEKLINSITPMLYTIINNYEQAEKDDITFGLSKQSLVSMFMTFQVIMFAYDTKQSMSAVEAYLSIADATEKFMSGYFESNEE